MIKVEEGRESREVTGIMKFGKSRRCFRLQHWCLSEDWYLSVSRASLVDLVLWGKNQGINGVLERMPKTWVLGLVRVAGMESGCENAIWGVFGATRSVDPQ